MSSGTKVQKSDRLASGELFLCAFCAIFLHLALVMIFCKEHVPPHKQKPQDRSNILFYADDPEFAAVTQKIRKEQDPAEFIRGGSTGYSSFRTQQENPQPYLQEKPEPLPPDIPEVDTAVPDLQRQYADLYDHRSLRITVQPLQKDSIKTVNYPVWTDAYGIIHEIKDAYKEHYAVNFNSKEVVGPTVLKIQFPEDKHSDLPPHISIQRSCGSVFLDYHAKKLLRNHIINKEFQKKFDAEYNNQIRIYWRPGLNPENKNMIPDNMLVQKEN